MFLTVPSKYTLLSSLKAKQQKAVCKQTISKANIAMYTRSVYHHGHKIADEVMLYNYTHRVRRHRDMYKNGINIGNKQFTVPNDKQFNSLHSTYFQCNFYVLIIIHAIFCVQGLIFSRNMNICALIQMKLLV